MDLLLTWTKDGLWLEDEPSLILVLLCNIKYNIEHIELISVNDSRHDAGTSWQRHTCQRGPVEFYLVHFKLVSSGIRVYTLSSLEYMSIQGLTFVCIISWDKELASGFPLTSFCKMFVTEQHSCDVRLRCPFSCLVLYTFEKEKA